MYSLAPIVGAAVAGLIATKVVAGIRDETSRVRCRLISLGVWTVAMLLWPLLWLSLLKRDAYEWVAIPSLILPIVIISMDINALNFSTHEAQVQNKKSSLFSDANGICGLVFASYGFVGAQKNECCSRIFLYILLGCIAFVLPAPNVVGENSSLHVAIQSAQKSVLAYATGFLVAGIMLVSKEHFV